MASEVKPVNGNSFFDIIKNIEYRMKNVECRRNFYFDIQHSIFFCSIFLVAPFKKRSAPGKATAKSRKYNVVAFFQFAFPIPQTKGKRTGGCITITHNVQHYL